MLQGKGSTRLLCVALVLVAVSSAVALATPDVPGLYDLEGARIKIVTTGTRYSLFGGREYRYRGEWEWQLTVSYQGPQGQGVSDGGGMVLVHERGTDGEHDFTATYGNGVLVWGQASSNDAEEGSSNALCGIAFLSGRAGKLKVNGSKQVYVVPPADDYATVMEFKGKQLKDKHR